MKIFWQIFLLRGVISLIWKQKYILNIIISIEIVFIGLFFIFIKFVNFYEILILFIRIIVLESCIGLVILILIIRYYGYDYIQNIEILEF